MKEKKTGRRVPMKRTRKTSKTRTADAILISDLHLTDKTPVARTDNYIEAQRRKLEFLKKLSKKTILQSMCGEYLTLEGCFRCIHS